MQPQLLGLMLKKDFWRKHKAIITKEMFPGNMERFYVSVASFHEKFEEDLDKTKLWEILKIDNPTLTDAQKVDLFELTSNIKELGEWTPEFAEKVLTQIWRQEVYRQVAEIGVQGLQGKLSTLEPLAEIYNKHAERFIPKDSFKECDMGVAELMQADSTAPKWNFALKPLQDRIGGMSGGQFLEYAARPDAGKTALMTTFMCGPGGWAEQGATIDYYGNEEAIKRTRWRCISAYTGMTKDQLMASPEAATEVWKGIAKNVRTFEIPFGTPVEHIIARTKTRRPNIVIVDQLDKLSVQALTSGGFQNEQDRTRLLRIKFRDMGKITDSFVVGVGQASADAEGQRIVTYEMCENSKTGKGAECDVFLGIGMSPLKENVLEVDYTRYITVSKNKLDKSWKGTLMCKLEPMISRYVE